MHVSLNDLLSEVSLALDAVEYEFYGARKYHAQRVALMAVGTMEELWWRAVPGGELVAKGIQAQGTIAANMSKLGQDVPLDLPLLPTRRHLVNLTDLVRPEGVSISGEPWADVDANRLVALFGVAAMHDNGLTTFYRALDGLDPAQVGEAMGQDFPMRTAPDGAPLPERRHAPRILQEPVRYLASHCEEGEKNIAVLPFYEQVRGAILYHHEMADGSGPFGKTADQTPLFARLIHLADTVDVAFNLNEVTPVKYAQVVAFVKRETGHFFDREVADAFLAAFPPARLASLNQDQLVPQLKEVLPDVFVDYTANEMAAVGAMLVRITDYKSTFTSSHSAGVARRVMMLAEHEGMDHDLCERIYTAGALHDIGKLMVPTSILEKPGALTIEETEQMKYHALASWQIIGSIRGMEELQPWAALHHEKLDGTGYPFGLPGSKLGHIERMMAVADIYQALTEFRPYRKPSSHDDAIALLRKMAGAGKVDAALVDEADVCYAPSASLRP